MNDAKTKKFLELKEKIQSLQSDKDQAQGALRQVKEQLKDEFSCGSIKQAQQLIKKYEKEFDLVNKKYEREYSELLDKWGDKL